MKLNGERNQCQGCKLYFRSNKAFDKHRTGDHGVDRRCRTIEEMKSVGMHETAGWWASEQMSADLKNYFNSKEESHES